jgi:excisionase family DNA binding protein
MNNLLTIDELAEKLHVSKEWVYKQTYKKNKGSIPRLKVGKYLRFDWERVQAWLKQK